MATAATVIKLNLVLGSQWRNLVADKVDPQCEVCKISRWLNKLINRLINGLAEFTRQLENAAEKRVAVTIFG